MGVRARPSPNWDARPAGQSVELVVLHYTGMRSAGEALDRLCDAAAKVSAHYLIDEDGTLWRLVAEDARAWHAGRSLWGERGDVNGRSLGIELVNPGHEWGYRPFSEPQMARLTDLLVDLKVRHGLCPSAFLGHSDVAPLRKEDPGELFDWSRLAAVGCGLWPDGSQLPPPAVDVSGTLAAIGYGYLDEDPAAVLRAFQRRFRPAAITGVPDEETARLIAAVANLTVTQSRLK